jgi:hypothetical protein
LDLPEGRDPRGWLIVVLGLSLWVLVLWPYHDVLPMWVEGMPAYMDQLVGTIQHPCTPPAHVLSIGSVTIPLAIDAYQGPLNTYLDLPIAHRWLRGLEPDPYAYRYKGIILLAISGLILFGLLRRAAPTTIAVLATFVFVTLPINAVCAIGDLQYHTALYVGALGPVAALVKYVECRRPGWLLATALLAGFALWTRAEALIWTAAAGAVYALVFEGPALATWWRTTTGKGWLALGVLVTFLVGAAPIVVFNLLYPERGLFGFLVGGSALEGARHQMVGTLAVRVQQFVSFNLLNKWGLYEVRTAHWVFLAVFGLCAATVMRSWMRERKGTFPLLALGVVLPLSVLAHRGPREIHLLPLTLAVVAVLAEGAARRAPGSWPPPLRPTWSSAGGSWPTGRESVRPPTPSSRIRARRASPTAFRPTAERCSTSRTSGSTTRPCGRPGPQSAAATS